MGQSTEELTRGIQATRQSLSRDIDELSDKVSPNRVVQRRTQAAKRKLGSLRDQVMGTTSEATEALTDTVSAAADSVQGAAQGTVGAARGNPLAVGLAAFAGGLVISSMIPASKQEARVAERAVEGAKEYGGPVLEASAEHLREAAVDSTEELKNSAQEAASHLKEEVVSAGATVKDQAQDSADSLAQSVRDKGATQG
ncbi:MAG: hypothetical protein JWQ32_564 [Marmoricola sp.]|nr:hypothetical protein [Marmoricola sp.]